MDLQGFFVNRPSVHPQQKKLSSYVYDQNFRAKFTFLYPWLQLLNPHIPIEHYAQSSPSTNVAFEVAESIHYQSVPQVKQYP